MSNKKTNLNINNSESLNDRSGFVVDLRTRLKTFATEDIEQIENKFTLTKNKLVDQKEVVSKKLNKELRILENKTKRFKPNLLKFSQKTFKIKVRKKNNFGGFFQKLAFKNSFFRDKSLWSKVNLQQFEIFKKQTKINISRAKKYQEIDKKRELAEVKVIWYRSIFSFVLVLLLIIVPLKLLSYFEFVDFGGLENKILGNSQLAVNNLLAATDSVSKMDLKSADTQFQNAGTNFLAAQEDLNKISDSILVLASFSNNPKLKLAAESKKFLRAGEIASSLGRNLVLATDSLFAENKESFSKALDSFTYFGGLAVQDSKNLKKELDSINPENLPNEYKEKFLAISKQTGLLSNNLETFVSAGSKFKDILGATQDKRYLLVFQNNSELRASGGFLGSYALVDIRDGKIRNLEVPGGGSYDTEGGMNVRVVAPKPLWLVNPLWHFWDANWWPDWPTTAQNLMWFYEKSDGPTVDGVISLTPTVVEGLLEITGPIDLSKEYGLVIDSNNFWDVVQKVVEQKNLALTNPEAVIGVPSSSSEVKSDLPIKQGLEVNAENKPKKIIGDLMAKIIETLPQKLNKESLVKILSLFERSMSEKQILFYFSDANLEAEVVKLNWAGEIKDTSRDYLSVVNTNIAGQKSDRKMEEKIEHDSEVSMDGSIIDTVKITRTHTGLKNEAMTGVRNVDWLRVYVPKGSELLMAEGFRIPDEKYFDEKPDPSWENNKFLEKENRALVDEGSGTKVYEENNKTVFANWVMVDPGESVTLTIKYRLPFNFFDQVKSNDWITKLNNFLNPGQADLTPYSLMVQKQPGAKASDFVSNLDLPESLKIFWHFPESMKTENGWNIRDRINSDKYWSVLIEKK